MAGCQLDLGSIKPADSLVISDVLLYGFTARVIQTVHAQQHNFGTLSLSALSAMRS